MAGCSGSFCIATAVAGLGNGLVVPDDFADDEVQELLGKRRVQVGVFGEPPQPGDLGDFTARIRRRQVVFGLQVALPAGSP